MANADVLFRFLGDAKNLQSASRAAKTSLAGVDDGAKKTKGGLGGLIQTGGAVAAGFAALAGTAVVKFLKDAAGAALEDNAAQIQLAEALRNTVGATDEQIAAAEEYIDATARQTGITDNELRPALAELTRSTGDVEKAQALMATAMDIATAKGIPLETVVKALGKGAQGNVAAMGRMNLKVRDSEGAFLSFEEAVAAANESMGGATVAAAESAEGRFKRLNVAIDEAKESLGNALLPILGRFADIGLDAATVAQGLGAAFENLDAAATDAVPILDDVATWADRITNPVSQVEFVLNAAADAVENLTGANEGAQPSRRAAIDEYNEMARSAEDTTGALQEFEEEVRSQIDPMFNLIDSINDLDEAQANTAQALIDYGQGSAEHREALRKEAKAWLDVKDAQIKAAQESGITAEEFRSNLEQMGIFTSAEMDLIIEDFNRANNYKFADKVINVRVKQGNLIADTRTGPGKAAGGPVSKGRSYLVGEQGPEIVTMGGNGHVTPNHALNGGRSPMVNHITINAGMGADPNAISRALVEALQRYERASGPIPISVRTS